MVCVLVVVCVRMVTRSIASPLLLTAVALPQGVVTMPLDPERRGFAVVLGRDHRALAEACPIPGREARVAATVPEGAIILRVSSERYPDHHDGWRSQVEQLSAGLKRLGVPADGGVPLSIELGTPPREGAESTKGVLLDTAVLLLASAHVIRAAAMVIREWKKQDPSRVVTLEVKREGRHFKGKGGGRAGVEAIGQALRAALSEAGAGEPDGK